MSDLGEIGVVVLLPPVTARTTTATGTAYDTATYANNPNELVALLSCGTITGTQGTLDVTIEECDTTDGSFTTVATFAQLTTTTTGTAPQVKHFAHSKRYVRAVGTTGGTSPSAVYTVTLLATKRVV